MQLTTHTTAHNTCLTLILTLIRPGLDTQCVALYVYTNEGKGKKRKSVNGGAGLTVSPRVPFVVSPS